MFETKCESPQLRDFAVDTNREFPQGLKPDSLCHVTARLKPCPFKTCSLQRSKLMNNPGKAPLYRYTSPYPGAPSRHPTSVVEFTEENIHCSKFALYCGATCSARPWDNVPCSHFLGADASANRRKARQEFWSRFVWADRSHPLHLERNVSGRQYFSNMDLGTQDRQGHLRGKR